MNKRLISILLTLCMALTLLPAALAAGNMTPMVGLTLYKVDQRDPKADASVTGPDIWNNWNVPYRRP